MNDFPRDDGHNRRFLGRYFLGGYVYGLVSVVLLGTMGEAAGRFIGGPWIGLIGFAVGAALGGLIAAWTGPRAARAIAELPREYALFKSYPWDMRVLIVTNLVYGLAMPVIEMFIGAYVMRKTDNPTMVVTYQLAVYTGIPFTFLVNGWLLKHVSIKWLYSVGMLLSGVSMVVMMSLPELNLAGLGVAGVLMGMSFGLYWSNRDFLALSSTNDSNRNYYYGLENFFATNMNIGVPLAVGAFIGWFGGEYAAQIRPGLPDRDRRRLRTHDPGLGHRASRPFPESTRDPIPLLPLPLAMEPHAIAGRAQGDRPRLHRHGAGHARHDPRGQGRFVGYIACGERAAHGRPALRPGTYDGAAASDLSVRRGLVFFRLGGAGQRAALRQTRACSCSCC